MADECLSGEKTNDVQRRISTNVCTLYAIANGKRIYALVVGPEKNFPYIFINNS